MTEAVEELKVVVDGDATPFDSVMQRAGKTLDAFVSRIEAGAQTIKTALDRAFAGIDKSANALRQDAGEITVVLDAVKAALDRLARTNEENVAANNRSAAAVNRLTREYKAGLLDVETYKSKLQEEAQTAESGSERQIAALSRLKQMRDGVTRSYEADQARETAAAKRAADSEIADAERAAKSETQSASRDKNQGRSNRSTIASAAMSAGQNLSGAGKAIEGDILQAAHDATEFDQALNALYATAGETTPINTLRKDLLDMGVALRVDPTTLAAGLYQVRSLGFAGAEGLEVLKQAAMNARGSNGDLDTSSKMIAKTLYAYGYSAKQAANVSDVFTVAVKQSSVSGKEFAPAWMTVLDKSRELGATIPEASAALALLTRSTKNASASGTELRALFSGLIAPTDKMRKAAHEAGLEWLATGQAQKHIQEVGLGHTLEEINAASKKINLAALFPDMRKGAAVFGLIRGDVKLYEAALKDTQNASGATQNATAQMDKSLKGMWDGIGATTKAAAIRFTAAITPVLVKGAELVEKLVSAFGKLPEPMQKFIGYGAIITAVLLQVIGAFLSGVGSLIAFAEGFAVVEAALAPTLAALAPFAPVIVGVIAAVALLAAAWTNDWGHIREKTAAVIAWMKPYFDGFISWLTGVWKALTGRLVAWWQDIAPEIKQVLGIITDDARKFIAIYVAFWETFGQSIWGIIRAAWEYIKGYWKFVFDAILGLLTIFVDIFTGHWGKAWEDIKSTAYRLGNDVLDTVQNVWNAMADGFQKTLNSMQSWWGAFWQHLQTTGNLTASVEAGNTAASAAHGGQMLGSGTKTPAKTTGVPHTSAPKPPPLPKADFTPPPPIGTGSGHIKHKHTRMAPGSVYMPLHEERIEPVKPFLPEEIAKSRTDADTFRSKVEQTEDHAAEMKRGAGGNADKEYAIEHEKLDHLVKLSNNAIKNISDDYNKILPEYTAAQKHYTVAGDNLKAYRSILDKNNKDGKAYTDDEQKTLEKLKGAYAGAKATFDDSKRNQEKQLQALGEAKAARRRYENDRTRIEDEHAKKKSELFLAGLRDGLKDGAMTRAEYDAGLQTGIAAAKDEEAAKPYKTALADSQKEQRTARENIAKEIARLAAKDGDFDLQRAEINKRADDMPGKDGTSKEQAEEYRKAALAGVASKEFDKGFKDADESMKARLADGELSLQQYRDSIAATLDTAKAKFGEQSDEANKLTQALKHIDWQLADEAAFHFKESLDSGNLSLGAYIAQMERLRLAVAATSPEYRKLSEAIDAAEKKQREARQATAGGIGEKVGDAAVAIFRKRSTIAQAFKETVDSAVDDVTKNFIKRSVSKFVMNLLGQKDAADNAKEAAKVQADAAKKQADAAKSQNDAADKLVAVAQAFTDAAQVMADVSDDGSGDGTATSGAAKVGSIFGIGDRHAGSTGNGNAVGGWIDKVKSFLGSGGSDSNASRAVGGVIDWAKGATSAISDAGKQISQVLGKADASGIGKFAGAAGKVLGYVGAAYTAYSVVNSLLATQERGFTAKQGAAHYASIGSGDHTGYFDTSAYSGVDGMRKLGQANVAKVGSPGSTTHNVTIHPGAITINGAGKNAGDIADEVIARLTQQQALGNAQEGTV